MPIYMIVNVLSMLIVSGGATLYAQSLGRDDKPEAQRFYTCSIVLMVICGAVMTLCGLLFTRQIIQGLGAAGASALCLGGFHGRCSLQVLQPALRV